MISIGVGLGAYFIVQQIFPDDGTYEEMRGNYKGAVQTISKSLSKPQHQNNVMLYVKRARNERYIDNYESAGVDIQKAVELSEAKNKNSKPGHGSTEANLVYLEQSKYFEDLKQYDKALDACNKALANLDRSEVHNQIAWILEAQGQIAQAEVERNKSVLMSSTEPNSEDDFQPHEVALHERAMFYKRRGDLDKALENLDIALSKQSCKTGLADRGDVLFEKGQYQQAIDSYTRAMRGTSRFSYHRGRARAYEKLKKYKEALSDYDSAIALNPDDSASKKEREALLAETSRRN